MPNKDGSTLRQHLLQAEKATGKSFIFESMAPENAEYLLAWFWELNDGRGGNGFGMNPLSSSEIDAWMRLTGNKLEIWEVDIIRRMDQTFIAEAGGKGT